MPNPTPDLNLVSCVWRGTYLDGTAASGTIELEYNNPSPMLDPHASKPVSVFPTKIVATITATTESITDKDGVARTINVGVATFEVPASNDPDITGSGATYRVTEKLNKGAGRTYDVLVDKDASIVYLNAAPPSDPVPGTPYSVVTVADLNAIDARVDVLEGTIGGGGFFTSPRISFVRVASNALPADVKAQCDFVCDGVNDQVQINQALALASRPSDGFGGAGYGGVQLVGPDFSVADDNATSITMYPSTTLQGAGWGTLIWPKWSSSAVDRAAIELLNANVHHVMIRDLAIGRPTAVNANGHGIKIVQSGTGDAYQIKNSNDPYNAIENVRVGFMSRKGIWLTGTAGGSRESQVRWVHLKSCGEEGLLIDSSSDSQVSDCRFSGNGTVGAVIAGGNTKVANCKAYYNGTHGYEVSSSRCEIVGLAAQDNGQWGFVIAGTDATASALAADSNSRLSGTSGGFYIAAKGVYEALNAFDRGQTPASPQLKGIEFVGTPQAYVTGRTRIPSGTAHITGSLGTNSYARIVRDGSTLYSVG